MTGVRSWSRRSFLALGAAAGAAIAAGCVADGVVAGPTGESVTGAPDPGPSTFGFSTGSPILWADEVEVARTLDTVVAAGARSVRVDVSWTYTEPFEGMFDWGPSDRVIDAALARGLEVLATITNTPRWAALGNSVDHTSRPASADAYGEFAGAVAQRYLGRVRSYEIWNEPNGRYFFQPGPDPEFYTEMLRAAYRRIKGVDSGAVVIGGVLGPTPTNEVAINAVEFLGRMYAAGAQGHFDALAYHPYDYQNTLAVGTLYETSPMRQMIALHELMARAGDGDKKIWITEYGAPTTDITENAQAALISGSMREWREVSFAGPFYVHTVRDIDSMSPNPEDHFGVVTSGYEPKPAFAALRELSTDGVPLRVEALGFGRDQGPSLGAALSPVYAVRGTLAQECQNGTRFRVGVGFVDVPPDFATIARRAQVVPSGPVDPTGQDFGPTFRIFRNPKTGPHAVVGAILAVWNRALGLPITDEYTIGGSDSRAVDFEHGRIVWSPTAGARTFLR